MTQTDRHERLCAELVECRLDLASVRATLAGLPEDGGSCALSRRVYRSRIADLATREAALTRRFAPAPATQVLR